jgi:hypothetical protein
MPTQAQPAVVIVDGAYRIYRTDRTRIALDARLAFVGRDTVSFTLEAEQWPALQLALWQRLELELAKTRKGDAETRKAEAEAHYQRGLEHSKLYLNTGGSVPYLNLPREARRNPQRRRKALADGIDAFESAVLLDPGHTKALLCLAFCLDTEEIDQPQRARSLLRRVAAQDDQEALKFIAAEKLGITRQLAFTPVFSSRVLTPEYEAGQAERAIRFKWEGWRRAFRDGQPPPLPLAEVLDAYEETMRAHCRAVMWKAERHPTSPIHYEQNLFSATQRYYVLSWDVDDDPAIAQRLQRILDWVWQDYPRLAPHFILGCELDTPGVAAQLGEMMARVESGRVEPLHHEKFISGLVRKMAATASPQTGDLAVGRAIGAYLEKIGRLGRHGRVYLAYCRYGLGGSRRPSICWNHWARRRSPCPIPGPGAAPASPAAQSRSTRPRWPPGGAGRSGRRRQTLPARRSSISETRWPCWPWTAGSRTSFPRGRHCGWPATAGRTQSPPSKTTAPGSTTSPNRARACSAWPCPLTSRACSPAWWRRTAGCGWGPTRG